MQLGRKKGRKEERKGKRGNDRKQQKINKKNTPVTEMFSVLHVEKLFNTTGFPFRHEIHRPAK